MEFIHTAQKIKIGSADYSQSQQTGLRILLEFLLDWY